MEKSVIMIVDDDEGIREFLRDCLRSICEQQILVFKDGELAWKFVKDYGWRIDLIITDFDMPKMNGIELLRKARKLYPEIGVIVMSGMSVATLALNAGADTFLKKPFKLKWLQEDIQELLS